MFGHKSKILCLAMLAVMVSCGERDVQTSSKIEGLSANSNARNVALIIGAPRNLSYVDKNLAMMKSMLESPDMAYNFEIKQLWMPTPEDVYQATQQLAPLVGEGGTFLWYFSGHGGPSGSLAAEVGSINFDRVSEIIKASRSKPLPRFVVIAQACYSGQLVNGDMAVGRNDSLGLAGSGMSYSEDDYAQTVVNGAVGGLAPRGASRLADQLLVMSSSEKDRLSMGGGQGSAFTRAFYDTFMALRSNPSATLGDLARQSSDLTYRYSGNKHHGQFRAVPEQILMEPLRNTGGTNTIQPSQPKDLFVMALPGETQITQFVISGSAQVAQIALCANTTSAPCSTASSVVSFTSVAGQNPQRRYFKAVAGFLPVAGMTYMMIGVDAQNGIAARRNIRLSGP